MIINVPVFMKHMLAEQLFVKNFYTKVHKILTTVLTANTGSWTDGRTRSPQNAFPAPALFVIA
jgi:hypothetical protein